MQLIIRLLSHLEKVFPGKTPLGGTPVSGSVFQNEKHSCQVAYSMDSDRPLYDLKDIEVKVSGPAASHVTVYTVELVPGMMLTFPDADADYLTREPGLFPDPLLPYSGSLHLIPGVWRSIWVETDPAGLPAGDTSYTLTFQSPEGKKLAETTVSFEILPASLPVQKPEFTQWFHYDCIANYYHYEAQSDAHWESIWKFVKIAADHGLTMLMTPLFTPPLDTEPGGERTTMQLVGVEKNGDSYTFNFDALKAFFEKGKELGIRIFEMSPLFTQWGAAHAPKIMGTENGTYKRLFGWENSSTGKEYTDFLNQFLPALREKLENWGLKDICWFHVSDEPGKEHLENYRSAYRLIHSHMEGFHTLDALSNPEFCQEGGVETPVPPTNHYHAFREAGVDHAWVYYCISQYKYSPNQFFAMPSRRLQILGALLWRYDVPGFLQWGYNFWNSQFSKSAINPWMETDAGGNFASGDSFVVYPGENGEPVASIRLKLQRQAFYDNRALYMLEALTSRECIEKEMDEAFGRKMTFMDYPRTDDFLTTLREKVNKAIVQKL